jgi:hypothetical protein
MRTILSSSRQPRTVFVPFPFPRQAAIPLGTNLLITFIISRPHGHNLNGANNRINGSRFT